MLGVGRFKLCLFDEEQPLRPVVENDFDGHREGTNRRNPICHIFVGAAELNDLLSKQPEAHTLLQRLTYLPPYMKLMVKVALKLGYAEGKSPPDKGDIEFELYSMAAAAGIELSDKLRDGMATAMGPLHGTRGSGKNKFNQGQG